MDKQFVVFSMVVLLLFSMTVTQYKLTGQATADVGVNVLCLIAISLPVNAADFGTVTQSATDSTTDGSPAPLKVQNDGSSVIDVTIARVNTSTPLFNGTGGGDNTSSFQFKARAPSTAFNTSASITTFTNVPGTNPVTFIKQLRFVPGNETAEVDLLIDVPSDEPPGEKTELLDFIAIQSSGVECGEDVGGPGEEECDDDDDDDCDDDDNNTNSLFGLQT